MAEQQGFLKNIINKLPYQSVDFNVVMQDLNPKYTTFQDTGMRRVDALAKNSIFYNNDFNNTGAGQIAVDGNYNTLVYANIEENKGGRLRDYRVMAAFSEISDALDEICDECINKDDNGNIVNLTFRNTLLDEDKQHKINEEFEKYIDYFNLEKQGFEYFRQLLIEGEIYFEHIIHKGYTKDGILGAVILPTDLIDPIYDNIQNMIIKGYILRKPIFNENKPEKIDKYDFIPMDENQISYVNSGIWNQDKTFRLPHIENARRAYRQLSLVEDAIVIYRLVRAPERLVFNVDVGNMAPPKAEAYLRKLIQEYWSKKTFDVNQSGQVQKFNPQSMLDSLNPDSGFSDGLDMLREELKFARFIIRLQQQFAAGLRNGFITHLKLTGLFEKYDLKSQNIHLEFNVPTNFYELRENQKLELKATNFNNLAGNEFVSATYAQKRYLGWNDIDVKANREFLRKDAELQWELQQIGGQGPNWRDDLENQGAEAAPSLDAPGELSPEVPPDFGGGPADIGGDLGGEEPAPEIPEV
jgi:hypothetical protein